MKDKIGPIQLEPITRLELIRYAGASGDFNPIHTIDNEAEKAGLPGIIAHGMLTMAKMGTIFSPYLERGFVKDFSVRFSGMVFLDDVISIEADLLEKTDGNVYNYSILAQNQNGNIVAKGSLDFAVL